MAKAMVVRMRATACRARGPPPPGTVKTESDLIPGQVHAPVSTNTASYKFVKNQVSWQQCPCTAHLVRSERQEEMRHAVRTDHGN